ncbi:hypothetical protein G3T14_08635 [Methylobacterium sp. BTF04]|uniref:hypothetical protein n=1 Tax=Methylobacterium sp. BTF04 TaxID=2708300 RepID=UPI0013CFAC05|nr:hypothetical protein [Methylobacterium sp. BTF04]NEU12198.1 hypothetical protein [Methylobacterium sp. BTF04]
MINLSLQLFCNRIVAAGRITADDVSDLGRTVLPDGITGRDEADMLIALDRAVAVSAPEYSDFLVAAIVDFAVWGERPTGYIDPEIAHWLVGSLRNGVGPTPLAARIAREVVREAQASDETLIAFALAANTRRIETEDAEILFRAAA